MDTFNQSSVWPIKSFFSIFILLTLSLMIKNTVFGNLSKELERAILNYNLYRVVKLLEREADPNRTAHTSYNSWDTLLTFAINNIRYPRYMYKHKEFEKAVAIIEALLNAGADPNMLSHSGLLPLIIAIRTNKIEVVETLLEAGADPNTQGKNGKVVLIVAIRMGNLKIVKALLNAGADPNVQDKNGKSALMLATEKNLQGIKIALREAAINKTCAKRLSNNS